jgi:predicted NBD/HSP70 family sugar kinase
MKQQNKYTDNNFLLIGIDGGATKVSGWQIRVNERDGSFLLGQNHGERSYNNIPGFISDFKPIELAKQLAEKEAVQINPTDDEQQQAAVFVEACAQIIEELIKKCNNNQVLIGMGMPGLKTEDKRGIAMIANGPRMIRFSDQLERRLKIREIDLVQPIHKLGSDADYCGIGENYSEDGLLRGIENGYYLGGGTGAADAMKLDGRLVPFDEAKEWIAKSWEMKNADGKSMEQFASSGGIQTIYADISGRDRVELNEQQIFPPQIAEMAKDGDKAAKKTYDLVVENLAHLFYERITALFAGWQGLFSFLNPNKPELLKDHPFRNHVFDRIIIGQRLGYLIASDTGSAILKQPVLNRLDQLIQQSNTLDNKAKEHYKNLNDLIHVSKLRAAPALGAGIDAYLNWKK